MGWQNIQVSSKILGHISAGVYRSPAGAIKELISNAFDANATRVAITTNWPSFDIITCRDNGNGITLEKFKQMMTGGIGDSSKRVATDGVITDITPDLNRPIIGWLGIGMLGVAQICHEFKIISHHRETKTAFQATVRLTDFLREKVSEFDPDQIPEQEIDVGKFMDEEISYNPDEVGTYIIASDMRSAFVRKFRESSGDDPLPTKFPLFLDMIHKARSIKEFSDYWQMVWELSIACPIPYIEGSLFNWETIKINSEFKEKVISLERSLKDYQFEVVVDGLPLRKPNLYPYPPDRRDGAKMTGQLFPIDEDVKVYGRSLKLLGYIYMQDGQAIEPFELRGLLLRIRNVAIGSYDPTFLKYPKIEGPRFNWLSGEIYVQAGLEHALNIDRDSFNEMNEHYLKLQSIVHNLLKEAFYKASYGVRERSHTKQKETQKKTQENLQRLVKQELGGKYDVEKTKDTQSSPVFIDTRHKKVLIDQGSVLWPKGKDKRELAQFAVVAFEISMLHPESERREKFYSLLSQFLDF